jgi:hypothetical protein
MPQRHVRKDVPVTREWATDAIDHTPDRRQGNPASAQCRHLSRRARAHADGGQIPWPFKIIEDEPTEAQR